MDQNQKMELEGLVHDFADVFSTGNQDLGCTDLVYHSILSSKLHACTQAAGPLPT